MLELPALQKLRGLEVRVMALGNPGARALAANAHLANLRRLCLNVSLYGTPAVLGWRVPDAAPELLVLNDAGAQVLASSPHLRNVEELDLSSNPLTAKGLADLLEAPWPLRSLELADSFRAHHAPGAVGEALASSKRPPTLRHLGLMRAEIGLDQYGHLSKAPCLANLESLDLEGCDLGEAGLLNLFKDLRLPALRHVRLERTRLCDKGALALAKLPAFRQLTSLEMGHNMIGAKGAAALAQSDNLAQLQKLTVNEPRWKDDTLRLFEESKTLAKTQVWLKGRLLKRDRAVD
ncbi:MAG: hypothetical protein QM765_41320 [Myxococcales bacterium]